MVDMPAPFNQLTSWQTKFKFKLNFPTTFAGNFQTLFFRLANIKRTKCAIFCLKPRNCFFSTFSNLNCIWQSMILCRKCWPFQNLAMSYTRAPYIQSGTSLKHFEQKSPADIILVCSLSIDHLLSPFIRVGGRGLSGKYQKTIWSGIFKHITLVPHISLAYIEFQGKCF